MLGYYMWSYKFCIHWHLVILVVVNCYGGYNGYLSIGYIQNIVTGYKCFSYTQETIWKGIFLSNRDYSPTLS